MKNRIKYIVIASAIVILVPVIIFLAKYINKTITIKDYEKRIVNFCNNFSNDGISKYAIRWHNNNINFEQVKNYDISPLIKNYFDQVEGKFEELHFSASDENRIIFMSADNYNQRLAHLTEKGDVWVLDRYFGLNRVATISELEKIIEHVGNDKYSGWRLDKDSEEIIELPYGFYLKYRKCKSKRLNKVKKILSCKFLDRNINYKVNRDNKIELVYLNTAGQEERIVKIVQFDEEKKIKLSLEGLFWENSGDTAHLTLCNRLYEAEVVEIDQEFTPDPT